jgi:hypothetical protein
MELVVLYKNGDGTAGPSDGILCSWLHEVDAYVSIISINNCRFKPRRGKVVDNTRHLLRIF